MHLTGELLRVATACLKWPVRGLLPDVNRPNVVRSQFEPGRLMGNQPLNENWNDKPANLFVGTISFLNPLNILQANPVFYLLKPAFAESFYL